MIEKLQELTGLKVYERSVAQASGVTYFLARGEHPSFGPGRFVGSVGKGRIAGALIGDLGGRSVIVGETDEQNAAGLREALPWTAPKCLGLATSIGFGDRLGLATPGHVRALRAGGAGLRPIFAQQSIREMARTHRTPQEVMDAATWGVFQEGYADGFGSDADHLQQPDDIQTTTAAGFTLFTIDPGAHVENAADTMDAAALAASFEKLDFDTLAISPSDLTRLYADREFALDGGGRVELPEETMLRAAVKYGNAVAHTVKMYRRLCNAAGGESELEVSVDETKTPTTPAEHYFFAAELKRLGVAWVSMAPRFVGRFEKGVDYIGDLDAFRASFAEHAAVMRTLGPYKISIHSGSDKFSVYPIVAELTDGLVHLKTAGTSYLEALRAIAAVEPGLFREIYEFARERYETDKATYHVSADLANVRPAAELADDELAAVLDEFDTRQALHVTFGSVLTADEGERFRPRIYAALEAEEEAHYAALEKHLARHAAPFARE